MEVSMIARRVAPLGLVLAFAGSALAAARIGTPGLTPPTGGNIICRVTNLGDNPVEFATQVYAFDGSVLTNNQSTTLQAKQSNGVGSSDSSARYCIITLLKGKKKDVRVNVEARDSSGATTATLEGR
jgi:hypothetical protein